MTTTKPFELFSSFVGIDDTEARSTFLYQHPALLSPTVEKQVASAVAQETPTTQQKLMPALEELTHAREFFESQPESYPLGLGPIEDLFDRQQSGEMALETATLLAATPDVRESLSPVYVDALCRFAFRGAYEGKWESPLRLHAILLSAVTALQEGQETAAMKNQVEGDWIDIASVALNSVADGRIYRSALAAGERTLKRARAAGDRELRGHTLHRLGTLNLDPYSTGRSTQNYPMQMRHWRQGLSDAMKKQVFFGDLKDAEMPEPIDALKLAQQYYAEAAEARDGADKGLSLKALVQAMFWYRLAGGTVLPNDIRARAREALALLDPKLHAAHVAELSNILDSLDRKDDQTSKGKSRKKTAPDPTVQAVDADSLPSLVAEMGRAAAWQLVSQSLARMEDTRAAEALKLARAARGLVGELGSESALIGLLQHELRLVRRAYAPEPLPIAPGTGTVEAFDIVRERSQKERWPANRLAASMLLLAMDSSATNDEQLGLQLLEALRRVAPALADEHNEAYLFLEAILWLGAGVNAVNEQQPATAIGLYGKALIRYVVLGLWETVMDCLDRVYDQAGSIDPDIGTEVVGALMPCVAAVQLRGSASMTELVQHICKRALTAMGLAGVNPEVTNALLQIAKGLLFDRATASGTAGNWHPDERASALLEEIRELEDTVPYADEIVTLGDPALNEEGLLLTGWAGENTAGAGSDPATRLVNLRRRFDLQLQTALAAEGDSAPDVLVIEDIQAALDERTVLLNVYLGAINGVTAVYAMLFTSDDLKLGITSHGLPDSFIEMEVHGRTIAMSPFAFQVESLRSALQNDPGSGVVNAAASQILAGSARGYLGHFVEELQTLRAAGKDHLCVVSHGPLHYFPWQLLGEAGHPLGADWIVTALPSLGMVKQRSTPATTAPPVEVTAIGVGFEESNPYDLPAIPQAPEECRQIAQKMNAKLLIDGDATETSVLQALASSRMVHIATHGAHNVDSPAFQHVYLTPTQDSDGRLHAYEMLAANLRGLELVTLSACETALGRFDFSDNPQGIPACLLLGGVSSIIGTLWPAETNASLRFFTTLYSAIREGKGRLDAFATAQGDTRTKFPQYRDWGAFYYIGQWR